MHGTFQWVGQNAGNIAILGMEDWNVSNVPGTVKIPMLYSEIVGEVPDIPII